MVHFGAFWVGLLTPFIHRESKKGDTILLSISSLLNIDRFSQFFHRRTQLELCNKIIIKDPISPQLCCYTTLWYAAKVLSPSFILAVFDASLCR